MDDNSNVLGPPVSFAEFNDLCDCKMADEYQHNQCPQVVNLYLALDSSDEKSID